MPDVTFARWDPIRDLLAIQQRMDRFSAGPAGWTPPVDLYETPERYVVIAELPGLSRDDIDIKLHEGRLTLAGKRRERVSPCEQYHRIERGYGTFVRTFQLLHPIAETGVTADLRDGVLTVICPKALDTTSRRIEIG